MTEIEAPDAPRPPAERPRRPWVAPTLGVLPMEDTEIVAKGGINPDGFGGYS
jgi:hypothetical protein